AITLTGNSIRSSAIQEGTMEDSSTTTTPPRARSLLGLSLNPSFGFLVFGSMVSYGVYRRECRVRAGSPLDVSTWAAFAVGAAKKPLGSPDPSTDDRRVVFPVPAYPENRKIRSSSSRIF